MWSSNAEAILAEGKELNLPLKSKMKTRLVTSSLANRYIHFRFTKPLYTHLSKNQSLLIWSENSILRTLTWDNCWSVQLNYVPV